MNGPGSAATAFDTANAHFLDTNAVSVGDIFRHRVKDEYELAYGVGAGGGMSAWMRPAT